MAIPHATDPQPVDDSPRGQLARAIGGTLVGDDLIAVGERAIIHCDLQGRVWLYLNRGDSGTSLGRVADGASALAANYARVTK